MPPPKHTEWQIAVVRRFYATTPNKEVALKIGKSVAVVKNIAYKLGLKKKDPKKRKWTDAELEVLRANFADMSTKDLAKALKCSVGRVSNKAYELGLKKSVEYMAALQLFFNETLTKAGEKTRYKKGATPANKGKKWSEFMPLKSQQNSRKTTFKKGSIPPNAKPDGYVYLVDGYEYVKNAKGVQVPKQHVVYTAAGNKIPKGHIVVFKDGNNRNYALDNLECISRKTHLLRNQLTDTAILKRKLKITNPDVQNNIINNYPEVIETKRMALLLTREINKV